MDKKKQIAFNLNNFLLSISIALDLAENDLKNTTPNHSKRVAFLSLKIAENYDLTPQEMSDLCAYSLVHNIALKKENNYTKEYYELAQNCVDKLPFLCGYKNVLKYHTEYYNGSGIFGVEGKEIPLLSQIISFSHLLDERFDLSGKDIENRKGIIKFLERNENKLFSEEIVNHFLEVASSIDFWLDIQNENDILFYIFGTLHDFTSSPTFEEVLTFTTIFSDLVEEDSDFIEKCSTMADFYSFEHKEKQTFLIAASLHHIGKLAIPNDILCKESKLTDDEYEIMKSYPYYTKKILSNLMGFNDITNWACRIQETIDGTGYPYKLNGKDLSLKDRLMSALNVYQSLTNKKPYRSAFSHEKSISVMFELVSKGKLDKGIVEDISNQLV